MPVCALLVEHELKRRALLILGMHRAGTSALARVAALRGARLPEHLMPANAGNISGYWEPEAIVQLNDRIFHHYATSWDDPFAARLLPTQQDFPEPFAREASELIRNEYGDADLILIKDPRCTLLQTFWYSVLRNAGIKPATVVIARPWVEVIDSLMRRDGTSAVGAALLYVAYGLEAAQRMDAGITCVTYEALISDWRAVTGRIAAEQGFSWPCGAEQARAEVEAYLRPGACSRIETINEVPKELQIWATTVWAWMYSSATGEAPDRGELNAIAQGMSKLTELAGPLLQDRKHARDMLFERLGRSQGAIAAITKERDKAIGERNKVLSLYHDTDTLLKKTSSDYQQLDCAHTDLQQAHAEIKYANRRLDRELALIYGSRSWRLTIPLRWVTAKLRGYGEAGSVNDHTNEDRFVPFDPRTGQGRIGQVGHEQGLREYLTSEFDSGVASGILQRIDHYQLPTPAVGSRAAAGVECTREEALAWANKIAFKASLRDVPSTPDVSIVVPVFNQLPFTLACVDALLSHDSRYSFEILIGDDASNDFTAAAMALSINGLRYMRHDENLGFVRNCNSTAQHAQGRYVLFLNNDTQVLPDWLDELIGTLERDASIGLVGSKLIYPNGRLQECGAIVWRDGSAWNYGRLADPRRPEFCYLRDVDYVSGASLALRTELWRELAGFDELFAPAYAEDADLAFRVRAQGLRTVVQPLSQILHFEGISSGTDTATGIKAHQTDNLRKLREHWTDVLSRHRWNAEMPELEKERNVSRRVLFVDHCTPNTREDAGSVVAFEIMRGFMANDYKVTFVPEDNFAHMGATTHELQRIGIEVIYHPVYWHISDFLKRRSDNFDVVFLHRFGVADKYMPVLRKQYPYAQIIFLNADLHFLREKRQAELAADPIALTKADETMRRELHAIAAADVTLVHSDFELDLLQKKLPNANVILFPLIHNPIDVPASLEARTGVCFVGGFRHPPNADGIGWFVRECWPLVLACASDAKLHIVGSHVTPAVEDLGRHSGVEVVGFVKDLDKFLARRRVTVAPLRYGAGAKGKVAGSLAQGVPVACTSAAAEGMRLTNGENILIGDDPETLARHVLTLLNDDTTWHRFSQAALTYAHDYTSRDQADERLRSILKVF